MIIGWARLIGNSFDFATCFIICFFIGLIIIMFYIYFYFKIARNSLTVPKLPEIDSIV